MIDFIDANKQRWGVEPICAQLPIAPSTYYAYKKRRELKTEIVRVQKQNYKVYGAEKILGPDERENQVVARCTVERLMRQLGIQGAVRGGSHRTTVPDEAAQQLPDLVKRKFYAAAHNRL